MVFNTGHLRSTGRNAAARAPPRGAATMAEDQGCCAGQGRAATISVLVLSIIVFFLNIVAMLYALQINAYYWIMAYHLAGTVCVLTATSVYACKCCGEGGFPLRRLGQVMFMYAACCGVVCHRGKLRRDDRVRRAHPGPQKANAPSRTASSTSASTKTTTR